MISAAFLFALPLATSPLRAQDAGPAAPVETSEAPAKPKPKPKPRPKPKPAAQDKPVDGASEKTKDAKPVEDSTAKPPPAERSEAPATSPAAADPPANVPTPAQPGLANLSIYCEPGKAVLFDGPKEFSFWVTRSGTVTIDNPLRPLTPEVTRVLQLVIADKIATAYGPDYRYLRRGGAPVLVEGALGGPIKWEAKLGGLPDTLEIVSDSGDPLAQMRFKECGDAPAAKALPVATKGRKGRNAPKPDEAAAAERATSAAGRPQAPRAAPRRLPQGAISE